MKVEAALLSIFCFMSVESVHASTELISCTDKTTSASIALTYDFDAKMFSVKGKALRKAMPGEKPKLHELNQSFPVFAGGTFAPFSGYDPKAGEVCSALSIPMHDERNPDWQRCHEGYSQLEWMGKYTGGKAETPNKNSDRKLKKYQDIIRRHCSQFDGKLSGVWLSIPNGKEACDRIGIEVSEFAIPFGLYRQQRLGGLYQDRSIVSCRYDEKSIQKVGADLKSITAK